MAQGAYPQSYPGQSYPQQPQAYAPQPQPYPGQSYGQQPHAPQQNGVTTTAPAPVADAPGAFPPPPPPATHVTPRPAPGPADGGWGCSRQRRHGMISRFDDLFIPDGDEARRWAEDELANPRYADAKPTWFDLVARDIGRFLADLFSSDNGANIGPSALIIVTVVIVAALIAALVIWGRPRSSRAVRRARGDLLGESDDRTAAQLRSDSERSARAGDWNTATILRYRAIARSLLERDLIDPAPGATAQSIARDAGRRLRRRGPAPALRRAAVAFDDVRYLGRPATEEIYQDLAATDERLRTRRLEAVPA